jgi:hypothetical protein
MLKNHLIRTAPKMLGTMQAWRGSKLTPEQAAGITVGAFFRPPLFVSASTSREVAETFRESYLVELCIPAAAFGRCCGLVHGVEAEATFDEVVLLPYALVRVLSFSADAEVIVLEVVVEDPDQEDHASVHCFPI